MKPRANPRDWARGRNVGIGSRRFLRTFSSCALALTLLLLSGACTGQGSKPRGAVTRTVDSSGATVAFQGGSLTLPARAVDQPTLLHVHPGSHAPASLPDVLHTVGRGVQVDLSGRQPSMPLRLVLSLEPTAFPPGVPDEALFVATFAPSSQHLQLLAARYDATLHLGVPKR